MEYFDFKGKKLSKFQLGTVQLGMKYGLGKDSDKPSEETAFAMLDEAMKLGVNNIDTANNYGDSQKVIGHWLKNEYWLAPRNPGPIVCWNENSNCLLEFESFPDGFEGDNFYFSLCFERNDKIYFLPAKSNMGITIDSNTKILKKWEIYTAEDVEIYQFLSIV